MTEYKFERIETAFIAGRPVKNFDAYRKFENDTGWVFAGQHSAPRKATRADMANIVEEAAERVEDE